MENAEIAEVFNRIADLLEIKGGDKNPFRIRSYRNAVEIIEGLAVSLKSIIDRGGAGALE